MRDRMHNESARALLQAVVEGTDIFDETLKLLTGMERNLLEANINGDVLEVINSVLN